MKTCQFLIFRVGDTILATEFEAEAYTYGVDEIIEHPSKITKNFFVVRNAGFACFRNTSN